MKEDALTWMSERPRRVAYDSRTSEGTAKAGGMPLGLTPGIEKSAEVIVVGKLDDR